MSNPPLRDGLDLLPLDRPPLRGDRLPRCKEPSSADIRARKNRENCSLAASLLRCTRMSRPTLLGWNREYRLCCRCARELFDRPCSVSIAFWIALFCASRAVVAAKGLSLEPGGEVARSQSANCCRISLISRSSSASKAESDAAGVPENTTFMSGRVQNGQLINFLGEG